MSATTSTTDTLDRVSMVLGTAMMIAWTLAIGIGGFVLLLAIAFGMVSQSLNLATVASGLLFLPLLLTVAWAAGLLAYILLSSLRHRKKGVHAIEPT